MNNPLKNQKKKKVREEHKLLAINTFYSFLHSYSGFFLSILSSFLIARMISKDVWGILILSTSYVIAFSLILEFLPPSLGQTMNYYIPQLNALNQQNKLKTLLKKSISIRFSLAVITCLISVAIFTIFIDLFKLNLNEYVYVFYILSPLIFFNGLSKVCNEITRSLNRFKISFYLLLSTNFIYITGLVYIFFFIEVITLESIALLILFSNLIPFLINISIVLYIIFIKIEKTDELGLTYKEVIKMLYKYGFHLSLRNFIIRITAEIKLQLIGFYENIQWRI